MSTIQKMIKQKNKVTQDLENAILEKLEHIAIKMNLDSVWWGPYDNEYKRDGKIIQSKQLDNLDKLYCDNIHSSGIILKWTKENGFC